MSVLRRPVEVAMRSEILSDGSGIPVLNCVAYLWRRTSDKYDQGYPKANGTGQALDGAQKDS